MKSSFVLLIIVLLLLPALGLAQEEEVIEEEEWILEDEPDWIPGRESLTFRLGGFLTESKKQVRDDADYYEYQPYGYTNFSIGMEYNFALNKYFTVSGGMDIYYKKVKTEFWADTPAGDRVKRQDFEFAMIPITGSIKLYPFGNGLGGRDRTVLPWIGGGAGLYIISESTYEDDGYYDDLWDEWSEYGYDEGYADTGFGAHIAGGIQYNFSERLNVGFEVRYIWAEAFPYKEYYGNDPLDLRGMNVFFTFGWGI